MPVPVTLEGAHVVLDPLSLDHADGLSAAAAEGRSTYALTSVPEGPTGGRRYVETALAEQAIGWSLPFAARLADDGRVVGSTRFLDLDYWPAGPVRSARTGPVADDAVPTVGEIGSTWYAASVQRTAVNTEAKLLLLSHAFDTWGLLRVTFKTDERNTRSRRAIERLGAQFEGVRRAQMRATDGGVRNTAYYSVIASEWPSVRAGLVARLERHSHTR